MNADEQSIALLQQILQALKGSDMGFCEVHGVRTIHIGRDSEEQSLWYFWNGQAEGREDIKSSAIKAFLKGVEVKEDGAYKGNPSYKLLLFLDAGDRQYRLRTGWNNNDPDKTTQAGKALVCAIAAMTPEQLGRPITIQVRPSETEPKLVFASISSGGQRVEFEWPSKDDWRPQQGPTLARAIGKVQSVWGGDHSNAPDEEQAPAPRTQAPPPTRPAPPARPTPAGQVPAPGVRSRGDILKAINNDHLRMEDDLKGIIFKKAMSNVGYAITTKIDTIPEEKFEALIDELLIAWGDSVNIDVNGLEMKLYGGDCSQEFMKTMAMCADEDPWKRAKFWANAVSMVKQRAEAQQSLNLTPPAPTPTPSGGVPF